MLDCVTEIPLPGRILSPPNAASRTGATRNPLPTFIAGPENRLVAGTIENVLTNHTAPSPLVLFGPSGTGKTHLAVGLTRHWQAERGDDSAVYTTAADFRHLLNDAIKRQAELEFRAQFRGRQLLVIEDLQQLPADDFALEELRYTLDDYEDRSAMVLATSNEPPAILANLPDDIRSRLASGLVLQLAAPGAATRNRILRQAATALGQSLSEEAADRLAHGVAGTANQLFSALFELFAPPVGQTFLSVTSANEKRRTDQLLASRAARRPTLREIMAAVARQQNLPQSKLKSVSRQQSIVFARGLVIYLARELADSSYEEIGRTLGGRDHTTVIHSYRKIAAQRDHDPQLQQTLEHLQRTLTTR